MYYKRVFLGMGMLLFPAWVISATPPPSALMIIFRFCWKRMVLSALLMTRTKNKSSVYFQGVTVCAKLFYLKKRRISTESILDRHLLNF
jgi:hypothetical protein